MAADLGHAVPGQPQCGGLAEEVDIDLDRGQKLRKADPLLHRLRDFLMVEGVARRVDEAAAVGDCHPAPAVDQVGEARRAAFAAGGLALGADRAGMLDEFGGDLALRRCPLRAHRLLAALGDEDLVTRQELFDLERIIGQRLGRRVDRGQTAADHDDRQAHGQIGDAVGLGRAGQLQRHQEIGGLPHPRREAVLHRDHGRPAGPGAQRDMIEAEIECAVYRDRAAKAHAAIHRKIRPSFEQQAHDLQEILVPANRDAVLGDAAEPRHDAVVEAFDQGRDIADRLELAPRAVERDAADLGRQRLDLEPIDRRDEMAVVQQVMR